MKDIVITLSHDQAQVLIQALTDQSERLRRDADGTSRPGMRGIALACFNDLEQVRALVIQAYNLATQGKTETR